MALVIYTFSQSVKHIYPLKGKLRSKLKATRLLQSQGLLVKVEVLVFIFFHLFPNQRRMGLEQEDNASGLKYYFLKPKAF